MEQAELEASPARLWAEHEHTKVAAERLYEQKTLLDLPQATFDATWPLLGENAVGMVAEGLVEYHLIYKRGSGPAILHEEYLADTYNLGGETLHARIYRFSTMPTAWAKAIEYLVGHFNWNVSLQRDWEEGNIILEPGDKQKKIAKLADQRMLDIVVHRARVSAEQGLGWSPACGIATLTRVCLSEERSTILDEYYGPNRMKADARTFERTHELLLQMHSREVGEMLAENVCGSKFPPELVELVADCFYDKELLISLKLGHHGINGM